MTPRWGLAVISALALGTAPAVADRKSDVKAHLDRAAAAHKAGRYGEALDELSAAYELDPQPELLFSIGQVHMKLGDCATATVFYRRFLATSPDPDEAGVVGQAIATCKDHAGPRPEPAAPPEPAPLPAPPPAPPPEIAAAPPSAPPPHPVLRRAGWYRDWLADALVAAGAVSGAVALLEYRSAVDDRDRADHAGTYGGFEDLLDSAHDDHNLALGFGAGAAVLLGAGVVRYLVGGRATEAAVAVVPTRGGQLLSWTASF